MLLPCYACSRHIRDHERACPFCGASVEAAPSKTLQRVTSVAVLGAALTLAACESSSAPRLATKYGAPPIPPGFLQPTSEPTSAASSLEPPKTPEPTTNPTSAPKKEKLREEQRDIYGAPPPPKKP